MTDKLISLATSAILCSLNISVWVGRRKDRATEEEVRNNKGARSVRAASVYKNLFAECPELEAIKSYAADSRVWFNKVTLPWDDNGKRLIPMVKYLEITGEIAARKTEFNNRVATFLRVYNVEISKQAFQLGSMFDRSEYPEPHDLQGKFDFNTPFDPVPLKGDFRVDISEDIAADLAEQYESSANARIENAMQDAWGRLRDHIEHIRDRVSAALEFDPDNAIEEVPTYDANGEVVSMDIKKRRRPKLHESLVDNGIELCGLLEDLNVLRDPKLEEMRMDLYQSLKHVDIKTLRDTKEIQESVKSRMEEILEKFK